MIHSSTVKIIPELNINGIYYIGQYGTSGYASAAKGYLYNYHSMGIPITWDPLYFDDSKLDDLDPYNVIIKSLINKPIANYDIAILHCTPDLWPSLKIEKQSQLNNKILIGYCTWETDKIPSNWAKCINESVHELYVPSTYNKEVFFKCGVKIPIRVCPHIFLDRKLYSPEKVKLGEFLDHKKYTFYNINMY